MANTMQIIVAIILSFDINGAIKHGTYAVHFTSKRPITSPVIVEAAIVEANTFLLPNINGYAASAKVPNARLIIILGMHATRSLDFLGATIFASIIPAHPIIKQQRSMHPRKLYPADSISNNTIGRMRV